MTLDAVVQLFITCNSVSLHDVEEALEGTHNTGLGAG